MKENKEIKWKPITPSAYDGSTIQRHHEDPADWRGVSKIEDRPLLSHIVEKESEAMRKFSSSWIDQYRAKYGFKIRHK